MNNTQRHYINRPTKIKFCGLSREIDVQNSIDLRADYLGFMFVRQSKRFVNIETTKNISKLLKIQQNLPGIVGVFANPSIEDIRVAIAAMSELTIIQLHGAESINDCELIAAKFPQQKIWKAVPIFSTADIQAAKAYQSICRLILFDYASSKTNQPNKSFGGSGKSFDWNTIATSSISYPFGIAGGIRAENIRDALRYSPDVIDVSSGIESAPGIKDRSAMTKIIDMLESK